MGYLGAGFIVLALLGGSGAAAGASGSCPAAALPVLRPAPSASPSPSASASPTPAPTSLTASPILTQQPDGTWTTTIYVNTAALCPNPPTFALVTTDPDAAIPAQTTPSQLCATSKSAPRTLTKVRLTFNPCTMLPVPPATAAIVMTPASATAAPVSVTVAVHRLVSGWEYLWIPLICGGALAVLLIASMLVLGLPDASKPSRANGHPQKVHGRGFWSRPMYAAQAWTFGGSWATNITAGAAVITAALTATGTVSELLPGVELGRFSLLIALSGGITVAATLVFGMLNYSFERVDPTTSGSSVITLPGGPVAVLSAGPWKALRDLVLRRYRYGGKAVTFTCLCLFLRPPKTSRLPARVGGLLARLKSARAERKMAKGKKFWVRCGAGVTRPDGTFALLPGRYRAAFPAKAEWQHDAVITVPAGATITVPGGASIPPQLPAGAPAVPAPTLEFIELAAQDAATVYASGTLSVPAGAAITVSPSQPAAAQPVLGLPGTSDIAVFAGQIVKVSPYAIFAAKDAAPLGPDEHASYVVGPTRPIILPGGAKISLLGRASLEFPAGTVIVAQGAKRKTAARTSSLTRTTVFPLPHTSEVVASRMWSLLCASFLTLFGAGAEIGILAVLAYGLSTASFTVRWICLLALAVSAVVVLMYSVVSIMALADPMPGDALNATDGTSFLL